MLVLPYKFILSCLFCFCATISLCQTRDPLTTDAFQNLVRQKHWYHEQKNDEHVYRLDLFLNESNLSFLAHDLTLYMFECGYTIAIKNNFFKLETNECSIGAHKKGKLFVYGYATGQQLNILISKENFVLTDELLGKPEWMIFTAAED